MSLLPFGDLPPHTPRRLVPAGLDLGDWAAVKPLFDGLEVRLAGCHTGAELAGWLLERSELEAALDEEASRRHIASTCHTDSPEAEAAYLHFIERLEPELKPRRFRLNELYLAHPARPALDLARHAVLDRDTALSVEVYREENVALETEESRLGNDYNKLAGSLTVQFRGVEKTLPQMARFSEDPDRGLREEAWRAVAARRLGEAERFDDLFDRLVELRTRMARNAGHAQYRDFAFRLRGRFDYTPADCERFHDAIEAAVMPAVREQQAVRRRLLGVDRLRPWDLGVDPRQRPPLRPFTTTEAMEQGAQAVFDRIDPVLAGQFRLLRERRLLDLENRKGKAPGGYQSTLSEARLPFIFMNAVGLQRDLETIFHEAGHAFHTLAARDEPLLAYRSAPIEFCEVASMAMELLTAPHLEVFYGADDARRARSVHLEGIVGVFPWVATVDAFQHWVYTHPAHTRAERREAWLALMDRFGGDVDWTGLEEARANLWHKQLHIFLYPFYYVEYAIAQLGALQVWANARRDPAAALAAYRRGLALGGSRPLPELFAAAGCRFDFSSDTLKPLLALVRAELAALN